MAATTALLAACSGREAASPEVSRASRQLSGELRAAVDPDGILRHAERFQEISEAHGGNRAAGTSGYEASAGYVAARLRRSGYDVSVQTFGFPAYGVTREAGLEVPGLRVQGTEISAMKGSGGGVVQAPLRPLGSAGAASGCGAADFSALRDGEVALLGMGTCEFATKAENAERAGARAVLIFDPDNPNGEEALGGSLGDATVGVPVLGISGDLGRGLLELDAPEVRVAVQEGEDQTTNVIAETPGGDADQTVMLGAHLDSVPQGPGINDNASGTATVLEIALRLSELDGQPRNKVRFAFWGAEELGLVGSRHYVESLGGEEVGDISAYLNFDMVGSPNFVRAVYDGPEEIQEIFGSYFEPRDIETEVNSALDGRSDHGPFQDEGIPTGGLFSGAGGEKSQEQQQAFGGEAGAPYDPCYHRACDDTDNLNAEALDSLSDGAAHATAVLAERHEQR